MKATTIAAALVVTMALMAPKYSQAQIIVKVRPVTPEVVVIRPAAPAPTYIWVDGYWVYSRPAKGYVWHEGYWTAPRPGYVYAPGYWVEVPGKGHKWNPPKWNKGGGKSYNSKSNTNVAPRNDGNPGKSQGKGNSKGKGKGKH